MSQVKITQTTVTDYPRTFSGWRAKGRLTFPLAVLAAIIPGVIGTAFVAVIAHAAGVANSFTPLKTGSYVGLIVLGVLAGAIGWQIVRLRARTPRRVLRRLVPLVLVLSFVPDVVIGITGVDQATWGGVIALMCAHVVVAGAAVVSFSFFLRAPAS